MSKEQLRSLRRSIDEVDRQIVRLLERRIGLARRIGEVKRLLEMPVRDLDRERAVLEGVGKMAEAVGLRKEGARAIFREIIAACRGVQEATRVAFLGPKGTFTEMAARSFFPPAGTEFIPCPTIRSVFRRVQTGDTPYGVVPVENTLEGSVTATLDQFLASDLMVYGEVELHVEQCLILAPGTSLEDVKVILSHPQALAQSRNYLEERLASAELREVSSTAEAVRLLSKVPHAAAIGTELAARLYGMRVVARGIQDSPRSYTRFFVLSEHDHPRTGRDKTSIIFSVEHVPGALYRALEVFAERGINLTKIESRPVKRRRWEYVFFLDFEGHRHDEVCHEALEALRRRAILVKVLGSYPTWGSA